MGRSPELHHIPENEQLQPNVRRVLEGVDEILRARRYPGGNYEHTEIKPGLVAVTVRVSDTEWGQKGAYQAHDIQIKIMAEDPTITPSMYRSTNLTMDNGVKDEKKRRDRWRMSAISFRDASVLFSVIPNSSESGIRVLFPEERARLRAERAARENKA